MTASLVTFSLCGSSNLRFAQYCHILLIGILISGCSAQEKPLENGTSASREPIAAETQKFTQAPPRVEAAPTPATKPYKAPAETPATTGAPTPAAMPAPAPHTAHNQYKAQLDTGSISLASKSPPKKIHASSSPEASSKQKIEVTVEKQSSPLKAPSRDKFEKVKAELAATPVITTPGPPGDMRVWIGDTGHEASFPSGMNVASAVISTSITPQTVLVTPNAPAFNIEPQNKCQRFDPTGTTVNFQLTPKFERNETYPVGARIEIFDQDNCKGDPIPKAAADIQVKVEVTVRPDDTFKLIRENISKLVAGLFALIVAFILFKARKLLKDKFGFEDKGK